MFELRGNDLSENSQTVGAGPGQQETRLSSRVTVRGIDSLKRGHHGVSSLTQRCRTGN